MAVVKTATALRSDNLVKELQNLIAEDSIGGKGNPRTREDDWLHVLSSENIAGVMPIREHPPELTQDLVWKNGPKWLGKEKFDC